MAALDTSRRAMLAAFAVAPVIATTTAAADVSAIPAPRTDTAAWDSAVATHRAANAAWKPVSDTFYDMEFSEPNWDEMEAVNSRLCVEHAAAYFAMLKTPAPTWQALAHKLEQINALDGWGVDRSEQPANHVLPILAEDARRLASREG